jgi:hypothetical protein
MWSKKSSFRLDGIEQWLRRPKKTDMKMPYNWYGC